jgi:hypothetical protein
MGRRLKQRATGEGQEIEAGWEVATTQLLLHKPLGAISCRVPVYWATHVNQACAAYERLVALHAQVASIPPGDNQIRLIGDEDVVVGLYAAGAEMVSNAVRSVQYLVQAMMQGRPELGSQSIVDRIKDATATLGISVHVDSDDWQGFAEMVRVRDALEHPTDANVYCIDQGQESVPLAWFVSDQSLATYVRYRQWFDGVVRDWEAVAQRPQEVTLTIERGIVSDHPVKKPRTL